MAHGTALLCGPVSNEITLMGVLTCILTGTLKVTLTVTLTGKPKGPPAAGPSLCCSRAFRLAYSAAVSHSSMLGQEQIRLRSPQALSIRLTGGQYLFACRFMSGLAASSRL